MTYKNKYIEKTEVLDWIQIQLPDAEVDDIPDGIMDEAHTKVDAELVNKKVITIPTENDDLDFLKEATRCFVLALLCQAEMLTQTSGELATNRFGDVMYQFQRTNPLFFFATGASEPFMDLLPYETLRMYALSFIGAYVKYAFYVKYGKRNPTPKMSRDASSRGAYWNEWASKARAADAEYGPTRSRWD